MASSYLDVYSEADLKVSKVTVVHCEACPLHV